jgi:hypothetical protein
VNESNQSEEKLSPQLEYVAERLNLIFAYFFCALEFEKDKDLNKKPEKNDRAWALQTIQNACLHTTLIALRDLDDFFSPRKKQSKCDDIKASDFGFDKNYSFLTKSERDAINKRIAHTTLQGVQDQKSRWDIFELTTKGVSQSLEFLKWVEKSYEPHKYFLLWTAALACRKKTQSIFDWLAGEVVKRQSN